METGTWATAEEKERAFRMGLGSYSNEAIANYLLRMANQEPFSYTEIAVLVEAAARLDSDTYLEYMKGRDND